MAMRAFSAREARTLSRQIEREDWRLSTEANRVGPGRFVVGVMDRYSGEFFRIRGAHDWRRHRPTATTGAADGD
jgi:hypothetical protein